MDTSFNMLFAQIGLETYYPQKLTLTDALTLRGETLNINHCTDPKKWYLHVLQNVMAYHHQCRSIAELPMKANDNIQSDNPFVKKMEKTQSLKIHPMDCLLALILCADDFLRQDLMSRLAKCQFAIPLILPDPHPECNLTFPLWALRSVVKEWKNKHSGIQEGPIITFAIPIVAFVRFDKQQERSKSKIMNDVISDSYHDYFFHRDNKGGNFDRQLRDGLLEVCWYLPSGKSTDIFPEAVAFLNLHGDAREHPRQVNFLKQMSFMNFALINDKDLDLNENRTTEVLKQLAAVPGGVFMLASGEIERFVEYYQDQKDIPRAKLSGMPLAEQNVDDIKTKIRQVIVEKISIWDKGRQIKIADCMKLARANDINVDEDKVNLKQGCKLANKLQMILSDSASTKERLLPLQGKNMWLKWAKEDKEEHRQINRGNKEVMDYSAQKREEKKKIRQLQLKEANNLNSLMESFINTLSDRELNGCVRNYFLHSLKLWLDEQSRGKISELRYEYNEKRSQLHQLQIDRSSEIAIKNAQEEANKIQNKMIAASFGLEHLLRELGQVYEAIQDDSAHDLLPHPYLSLPSIAAELLIDGFPLEIMDGDAAHVPIVWVTAVLKELANRLKDPRVFIISILGLQSTGKSTLLNTVFGLHFSVSAGRCTRGAFLQLLPVDEGLKEKLRCDFFMIVDTEGLRAPEQDSKKARKHDNELATFVTGIANATTVNFGGEAPGDMDDIMQTVVHAFIRMKTVKLNPSCQFVYQHTGEVAAGEKGGLGHYNFKDNLDKMTKQAATEEESDGKYEFFNDVIQFDPEKDSHHFPDLWKGDPPMGSVNPGYCDKALALKHRLVQVIDSRSERLSAIELKIEMFWKALLHEKFVFSFRNTLETRVYSTLEKEYIQWALDFRNRMLKHEREARNRIKNVNIEKLESLESELLKSLPTDAHNIHEELEGKLVIFFEDNEDREMLAQWQAETQNRLDRLERELQEYAKSNALELISTRRALADVKEEYKEYKEDIKKKVLKLVANLEKEDILESDSEVDDRLKGIFDKEWENWKKEIERTASVRWKVINIVAIVENSLTDFFKTEEQRIIVKLKERSLKDWGKELRLKIKDEHIRCSMHNESDDGSTDVQEIAKLRTEKIFGIVEKFLENLQKDYFDPSYAYQLLEILQKSISEQSADASCVDFTSEYRIDLSLTVCGYALEKFHQMIENFRKENSPLLCLEREEKVTLFNIFKNHYQQVTKENAAACTLCDLLSTSIKKQVMSSIGEIVFNDIKNQKWLHFQTKSALKTKILVDLGEDLKQSNDLTEYFLFLENVGKSLKKWIEHYVKEYCRSDVNGQQQLVVLANKKSSELIENIQRVISNIRKIDCELEHGVDTQEWLNVFCSKLENILVMDNFIGYQDLGGVQTLKNVENFEKEVKSGLLIMVKDLHDAFKELSVDVLDTCENKPHVIFSDNLIGCTEQCPFCKEQCDCTLSEHSNNHQVEQHRPQGLGGYFYHQTHKMVLGICSCEVGTDHKFKNRHTEGKWMLYKEFHKIYPSWSIPVDMSAESSTYWKWFVARYSKAIADNFEMLPNENTSNWENLTWEDAKKELQVAYKAWFNKENLD